MVAFTLIRGVCLADCLESKPTDDDASGSGSVVEGRL